MGGCASVPKDLKAEAAAAPPPEPQKEEETVAQVAVDGGDDKPKEDEKVAEQKVADENENHQSLSTLLNEGEAKQEISSAEAVPSTAVKPEEGKTEPPPVYDAPAVMEEPEKPSGEIFPAKEENKKEDTAHK